MPSNAYPEILADLADQVGGKLIGEGIGVERAAEIGFEIAEHIRKHWSKSAIYIPAGDSFDLVRRDMEIFERCRSGNYPELAKEYNLTVVRIYQIVKAVREEIIKKRQGALF